MPEKKKYVYCYTRNGVSDWTVTDIPSVAEFEDMFLNAKVRHVFEATDDVLGRTATEEAAFAHMSGMYGFLPSDYGTTFVHPDTGHAYRLVGFRPKNRKYKALCINETTGHRVKCTLGFVHTGLAAARTGQGGV